MFFFSKNATGLEQNLSKLDHFYDLLLIFTLFYIQIIHYLVAFNASHLKNIAPVIKLVMMKAPRFLGVKNSNKNIYIYIIEYIYILYIYIN